MEEQSPLIIAYAKTKIRSYVIARFTGLAALLIYFAFILLMGDDYKNYLLQVGLLGFILLTCVGECNMRYRLKHGLLGTCKSEVLEIAEFVLKLQNKQEAKLNEFAKQFQKKQHTKRDE